MPDEIGLRPTSVAEGVPARGSITALLETRPTSYQGHFWQAGHHSVAEKGGAVNTARQNRYWRRRHKFTPCREGQSMTAQAGRIS